MIPQHRSWLRRHLVWVLFVLVLLSFGQRVSAQSLTNDDVVKMAQAQLPDSVISAKIKSSKNAFDTSPDALIRLKQAGVSDSVLSAMTEPPPASGPASGSVGPPLPTALGFYVIDGSEIRNLSPVGVETRIGLLLAPDRTRGYGVDGFSGEPAIAVRAPKPTIIAYQQSLDVNSLHLGELVHVSAMKAYEFNISGSAQNPLLGPEYNAQLFHSLYGRDPNDTISINLWRPKADVPFHIEPVETKPGMYRLIPDLPLPPGRYALYSGNGIHRDGMVFGTETDRRSQALYFSVTGADSVSTQSALVPGAACADYNSCVEAANAALSSSQLNDATAAWDKALGLGGPITLVVCHERGLSSCEKGNLLLGAKEVSFTTTTGQKLFTASPSEVSSVRAYKILSSTYVRLSIKGKNYNFDFLPIGVDCEVGMLVKCPSQGIAQQVAVDDYVWATVAKLASGALTPAPAQPTPTAAPSSDK